jgi:hypothetical protein
MTRPQIHATPWRMTMFRQLAPAVLVLVLAACGKPAENAVPAPQAAATETAAPEAATPSAATPPGEADMPAIALDPEGLRFIDPNTGSSRLLAFGAPLDQTVAAVDRAAGVAGERSTNGECPAGPMGFAQYPDGLDLLFQDGKFVGWSADRDSAGKQSTMAGVGVGSTRAELLSAYAGATVEETTLGQEFTAGGLSGVLSGPGADAKIEALWAGTSCVFR